MHDEIEKTLSKFFKGKTETNKHIYLNNLSKILNDVSFNASKYYDNSKSKCRSCPYCGKKWSIDGDRQSAFLCGKQHIENPKVDQENGGAMVHFFSIGKNKIKH